MEQSSIQDTFLYQRNERGDCIIKKLIILRFCVLVSFPIVYVVHYPCKPYTYKYCVNFRRNLSVWKNISYLCIQVLANRRDVLSPLHVRGRRQRELQLCKQFSNSTILSGGVGMAFVGRNNNSISSYSACLKGEMFRTQCPQWLMSNVCAYGVDISLIYTNGFSYNLRHG